MALTITTTVLAAAYPNVPYSASLNAVGGTPAYTWAITAGALPAGLSLSPAGVISGTPGVNSAGTYSVTVQVTDSLSATATQVLTLAVNSLITLRCAQCGFYVRLANMGVANQIAAVHQGGRAAHVVSMT